MKIDNMRAAVKEACLRDPRLADDDRKLTAYIWRLEGWSAVKGILANLEKVSSPERIRRARQVLVQDGEIKPSKEVHLKRHHFSLAS